MFNPVSKTRVVEHAPAAPFVRTPTSLNEARVSRGALATTSTFAAEPPLVGKYFSTQPFEEVATLNSSNHVAPLAAHAPSGAAAPYLPWHESSLGQAQQTDAASVELIHVAMGGVLGKKARKALSNLFKNKHGKPVKTLPESLKVTINGMPKKIQSKGEAIDAIHELVHSAAEQEVFIKTQKRLAEEARQAIASTNNSKRKAELRTQIEGHKAQASKAESVRERQLRAVQLLRETFGYWDKVLPR